MIWVYVDLKMFSIETYSYLNDVFPSSRWVIGDSVIVDSRWVIGEWG